MSRITKTFTATGETMPDFAREGMGVSYTAPAGCVLRRSTDMQAWEDVATPSPFVHTGAPAHYRIVCDTYDGTPKQATLTITGGGA